MNSPSTKLWYLPPCVRGHSEARQGGLRRLAAVTPALVRETVQTLDAEAPQLRRLSVETIIAAIDRTIHCWQEPRDPGRGALLEHGPSLTGYPRQALQHAIDVMLSQFAADGLRRLIVAELGDPAALDGFVPIGGTLRLARGPGRQLHIFAGGVPTVPIFSLICSLLLKSVVLAKPSAEDPLFPALFAQALAHVEPRLANALAVIPWSSGLYELEREAIAGAGAVVVYGSDETVAALRSRTPAETRFVGYGHALSVAAVARAALSAAAADETARRLARDVALFDQHGCLSPQFAVVELGGEIVPSRFAALVAAALEALSANLPRGTISPAESLQIQSQRALARFQSASGSGVQLWHSGESTDWTVIYRAEAAPAAGRNRVITIVPVDDLASGLSAICSGLPISTIGIAAPKQRLLDLAPTLAPLANRLCPLGLMGEPPIGWHHDGQTNLGPLVTWVDLETG